MDEHSTVIDLFGDLRYVGPRQKGRPPFEWTEENSRKVSMLLAMGWGNLRIANTILDPRTGKTISVPTLKRYFRAELQVREAARDRLTAKQLMLALTAAEDGNVGAMRLLDQLVEKNDRMLADAALGASDRPEPRKGKKELSASAAAAAEEALLETLEAEAHAARPN